MFLFQFFIAATEIMSHLKAAYAVVEFPATDENEKTSIEAIPFKWLSKNGLSCHFPTSKTNFNNLVKQLKDYNKNWKTYETKVLHTAGNIMFVILFDFERCNYFFFSETYEQALHLRSKGESR